MTTEKTETGTALALPAADKLMKSFEDGTIDKIIDRIAKEVAAHVPDTSTAKGRAACVSLAAKVSKSKKPLDDARKALTEEWRTKTAEVNAHWKAAETRLDEIRDAARKPTTDWEKADEERKAKHREALLQFDADKTSHEMDPEEIQTAIDHVRSIVVDESWEEFEAMAETAKAGFLDQATKNLQFAQMRVDQAAEIARLKAEAEAREAEAQREREARAKEAAEREAREKAEREAREKAELEAAAEHARILEAERQKEREEAEAKAAQERAEKEAKEREERLAREAEEAEQRRIEAERRHAEALEQAKKDAAEAEAKRIADEKAAEEAEANKRAADAKHRKKIRDEIAEDLKKWVKLDEQALAVALMEGEIRHVKVIL